MRQHVVWDWNGTLFDDQHVVLEAVNRVAAGLGAGPVTMQRYRDLYTRPVRMFYEQLFERPLDDHEWAEVDTVYHAAYRDQLRAAALASDALEALERVGSSRSSQSLLSMWHHHELVPLVERMGIHDHFDRVDGLTGPGGGHKAPHLTAHLDALGVRDPAQVILIGDALDDAAAAAAVGASVILYDGGSHARAELERAGVPVVGSLLDALELTGLIRS